MLLASMVESFRAGSDGHFFILKRWEAIIRQLTAAPSR